MRSRSVLSEMGIEVVAQFTCPMRHITQTYNFHIDTGSSSSYLGWEDAEKAAEKALAAKPEHFLARFVRAQVYDDRGDIKRADAEYRWFVRTFSDRSQNDNDIKNPEELLLVGLALALLGAGALIRRQAGRAAGTLVAAAGFLLCFAATDTIPRQLLSTLPYVVTLAVLAFAPRRLRPPAYTAPMSPINRSVFVTIGAGRIGADCWRCKLAVSRSSSPASTSSSETSSTSWPRC